MIKQTWNINEDEKNRILNLHESATKNLYLVAEQLNSQTVNTVFPSQNIGDKFAFGEYDSQNVKNSILALKPQIEEFIKNSGENEFSINISSGESNVTNPKGFETKGSLGLARANSVKKYFQEIFPDLIKQGVLVINSPKSESEVKIGTTPYNKEKGDNKNPELIKKYREEQFVTFDISGVGKNNIGGDVESVCDFKFDQSGGQGLEKDNYVTLNRPLKDYGELSIDSDSIPDRMVVVNEQNVIVSDTGYVATGAHQYSGFKYVPSYVYSLTFLNQIKKNPSVSGDKIITTTVETFEELMTELLVDPSKMPNKSDLKGELSIRGLQNLFDRKVRTFVLYSIGGVEIGKIPFDSRKGDSRVIVYSPVGQTGYTLTGNCPQQ
jgi:hypothetical protein